MYQETNEEEDMEIRRLEDYIKRAKKRLIRATRNNTNNSWISKTKKNKNKNGKKNHYMVISSDKQGKSDTR